MKGKLRARACQRLGSAGVFRKVCKGNIVSKEQWVRSWGLVLPDQAVEDLEVGSAFCTGNTGAGGGWQQDQVRILTVRS